MTRSTLLSIGLFAMLIIHSATSDAQTAALVTTGIRAEQTAVAPEAPQPDIIVPAGTRILTSLLSPLQTVSASEESGIYLETCADVIVDSRVVIPAGTKVQGTVESTSRPGRAIGRSHLQFRLNSMILPNNFVIPISGGLESLPGSSRYEKKRNGVLQPVDQIDRDAHTVLATVVAGALFGAMSNGAKGAAWGSLIGGVFGVGTSLFTRGDDIQLRQGTRVEIALDSPINIPVSKLTFPLVRSATTYRPPPPPPESVERPAPRQHSQSSLPFIFPRF
jgi:hypothetical protein